MTDQVAIIVSATIVGAVAISATLVKLFGRKTIPVCPVNAGSALDHLAEAIRDQTRVLGEIRDKLIGMGYEQQQAVVSVGRVETSLSALHRRFDSIKGTQE